MIPFRLLLPVLSFTAGAGGYVLFQAGAGPTTASRSFPPRGGSPSGGAGSVAKPPVGDALPAAVLTSAGLDSQPSLDDVFNAVGMDRMLRIGIFLQTATSADLEKMLDRCNEEGIYETILTDPIWLRWVEIDREAAFKRDPNGTAFWWAWTKLDPQSALAAASQANPENLEAVIRAIGQGDHTRAIQLLSDYPAADTPLVWEGILNGLGKTDRASAAALALEKNVNLQEHVSSWTARDPEQALAWARALPDPIQQRRVLDHVLAELGSADPVTGLRETALLPPGRIRTERMAETILSLARQDPAAARQAAETLTSPAERQQALASLASYLAARDPAAALAILQTDSWRDRSNGTGWSYFSAEGGQRSVQGETSNEGAKNEAVSQLMQSAPLATATALAALPDDQQAPLAGAVQQWAGHQPEAASTWLQGLPAGPVKDRGIEGLTRWLRSNPEPDYDAALAWAGAATADLQPRLMSNMIQSWKEQDWKAARAAVDRLPLTEEQRERFLQDFK